MIISVEEFRTYVDTDLTDDVIKAKLDALEVLIRKYTNNNFQVRAIRSVAICNGEDTTLSLDKTIPLKVGDTVQISASEFNPETVCVIESITDNVLKVDADSLVDDPYVIVTKVSYPKDVILGVVNMMRWDLENRSKVGIQSETISRHSVTYFNMDADNSIVGFPKSLIGFLMPYMKARF